MHMKKHKYTTTAFFKESKVRPRKGNVNSMRMQVYLIISSTILITSIRLGISIFKTTKYIHNMINVSYLQVSKCSLIVNPVLNTMNLSLTYANIKISRRHIHQIMLVRTGEPFS